MIKLPYRCRALGGGRIAVILLSLGVAGCAGAAVAPPELAPLEEAVPAHSDDRATPAAPAATLTYSTHELPSSTVHLVTVPPGGPYQVGVAIAESLAPLPNLATAAGAIAAINAGFFDPHNGLTTSYLVHEGQLVADPRQNPRLMENPDLTPYLSAILDRSEFRVYTCEGMVQYDITRHSAPLPTGCELANAVGAGPQLLPTLTGYEEGFLADNAQGVLVRDALGSQSPNARSAVGLKPDGTVVLAIAAQPLNQASPTGLSLADLTAFLASQGVTKALNLDGGSSTGLYLEGQTHYGRLNEAGIPVERPIKSILWVR